MGSIYQIQAQITSNFPSILSIYNLIPRSREEFNFITPAFSRPGGGTVVIRQMFRWLIIFLSELCQNYVLNFLSLSDFLGPGLSVYIRHRVLIQWRAWMWSSDSQLSNIGQESRGLTVGVWDFLIHFPSRWTVGAEESSELDFWFLIPSASWLVNWWAALSQTFNW